MSGFVSLRKGKSGSFDRSMTLDDLWVEAECLGNVSVESSLLGGYSATISFKTKSGSRVFARGEAARPNDALIAVIDEAVSLGAK